MAEFPPWVNTVVTVILVPATITVWRWFEKRDASRISQAVDRMEHLQNADDEIRHAYLMNASRQSEQIVTAIATVQQGMAAQNTIIERQTTILDGLMRTQMAADMREQERDRILRGLLEEQQRTRTILATVVPQLYQPAPDRPWEQREADHNE